MKTNLKITSLAFVLSILTVSEAFAQRRPSAGRTSERTGSSSSSGSGYSGGSSSSGSSSSGSSYSGGSSSSSSSSSRPSRSSGSSYSDSYSGGSSSSTYSRPTRSAAPYSRRSTPRISNRSPSDPVSNGQVRNVRNYRYGEYKPERHRPTTYERTSPRTSYNNNQYYRQVNRSHIYFYWVFEPVRYTFDDGYCYMDNYDWYCYQGYRYRYSDQDRCHYELIDTRTNVVVQTFKDNTCKEAYDSCALERDRQIEAGRSYDQNDWYVCAERVDEALANTAATGLPSATSHLPKETVKKLSDFVESYSTSKLFKLGKSSINDCKIEKAPKNESRCNYQITVKGQAYPEPDGKVCSNISTSEKYGCAYSSQKQNATCLLSLAIMEGLCLDKQNNI